MNRLTNCAGSVVSLARVWPILLGLLIATAQPLAAQVNNNADAQVQNVFRPAPRELVLRLARARKAIENEEYNDAVIELGRLLSELEQPEDGKQPTDSAESQDYFVARSEGGTHVSLKSEAQRLIGSMPTKGREWYEVQFGAEARKLLEDGTTTGDIAALTTASRRFFHTKAGYEATLLLGRHYMDHGQPLAAALCLKRLSESPAAADFEPELSVLLATCWYQAGLPEKSEQTLAALGKRRGDHQLRVAGNKVDVTRDQKQGMAWLSQLVGNRRLSLSGTLEWLMFRGNATRTATSPGDIPLATPRWRVPTVNNPNDERLVEQVIKKLGSAGTPALPALHPLAIDDVVLMRSAENLLGVDFKTGKRVWVYPWDDMEGGAAPAATRPMVGGVSMTRESELKQRLWEDSPFGQISSDGQSVYFIHGLGYVPPNGMPQMQVVVGAAGRINRLAAPIGNRLVALDVRRQGKLLWEVGDPQGVGGGDRRLANAFFLGAPLPLQGHVYVLAEVGAEVRLVAIDARSGAVEWQQQLAHLEARNIMMDPSRRLAGATPSFADGVMICPTSAGAVVAVDLATRTLLWGFQYQKVAPDNGRGAVFFQRTVAAMQARQMGQRWSDATVTVHDGRVLMTPIESDEMYCLDLLTGKSLWPTTKRGDLLYVGGVHDGKVILVGKQNVTALRWDNGSPAWMAPADYPDGGIVSGRGFQSDAHYYVPTTASQLVRIDLKTGKVDQQVRTERPLGNLICYHDEIISQGVDGLSTFPMVGPLRKSVAARLEQNPRDSQSLARLAELQSYDGKRDEALATLRRAVEINPDDETLKSQLVRGMLDALRTDFAGHRRLASEVESMIEQPAQREQFLRLMASGLQQIGDIDEAFDMYLKLAAMDASRGRPNSPASATLEDLTRRHAVRRDRWIQAQLASIYREVTPAQRERMDAALLARQRGADGKDDIAALREFVRYYGFHATANVARIELARRLIESDQLIEAEVALGGLDRHPEPTIAIQAVVTNTQLLLRGQQWWQASLYAKRLESEFAAVPGPDGLTGQQWFDRLKGEWLSKPGLASTGGFPYGKLASQEGNRIGNATYSRMTPLTMLGGHGAVPDGATVTLDSQQTPSLVVRDGIGAEMARASIARTDGQLPFFYYATNSAPHMRAIGHLFFAHIGTELVAVNALRIPGRSEEAMRWRTDILQRIGENDGSTNRVTTRTTATPWGGVQTALADQQNRPIAYLGPCNTSGVFVQKGRELSCLDPLTGEVIWMRSDMPQNIELYGDEQTLVILPVESKELILLSALDGQELSRQAFDPAEQRWGSMGRNLLTWTQSAGSLTLRLTDIVSGTKLFEQKFANGSRGVLIQSDEVAVLQPDGQFTLMSLRDGETRVRGTLEAEPGLMSLHVLRSREEYLVVANGPPKSGAMQVNSVPGVVNSVILNGHVYQFDRRTGKARWPVPAIVEQFGLPLDQPAELPVLVFMRNAANRGKSQSALLVLDRRDGRQLLFKDDIPVQANFAEIVGKQTGDGLTIQMGTYAFDLTFTNEPPPPQPPAQTGSASSTAKPSDEANSGLIGSILNSLGKGARPAEAKKEDAKKEEAKKEDAKK